MRVITWLFNVWLLGLATTAGAATLNYTTYYHNDHLGSPVAATDERGGLLWRAHFRPYGERQEYPKDAAFGTVGYTGHAQDKDSGLVYAGARYMDPVLGRFMAVDPVGFQTSNPLSFNRYAYGSNNPQKYVDPDGRIIETAWDVASIVMGVASAGANIAAGNYGSAAVDTLGVIIDTGAMLVPGVPGGAGAGIKAFRAADEVADVASKVNKNSRSYKGATHVYAVRDSDGDLYKIGESAAGTRLRDGASIRAEKQVRGLNRQDGPGYTSEIRKTFTDKDSARTYETKLIERYRRMYGQDKLPGNKTNR